MGLNPPSAQQALKTSWACNAGTVRVLILGVGMPGLERDQKVFDDLITVLVVTLFQLSARSLSERACRTTLPNREQLKSKRRWR